jgi:thiamine biosynthesis lipoprotein
MGCDGKVVVIVFVAAGIAGCGGSDEPPLVRESAAMNTYVIVSVYDRDLPEGAADRAADSAFAEIRRVEAMASDYIDTSEVGRLNAAAGVDSVQMSGEMLRLLRTARDYSIMTGGLFDPTVGPVVREWDFLADTPHVPTSETLRRLLRLVDYRKLVIGRKAAFLPERGMRIDLGAIAKGYAVDRAVELMRGRGLRRFIIDIGGNLGLVWDNTSMADTNAAMIEVRHPRREGAFLGSFRAGTAGIATSGDYQRNFFVDGVRYHHILNPRTGLPARDLAAVTVIAPDAITADAYSTIIFLLGREKGLALLDSLANLEGLVSWEEGDSLLTQPSSRLEGRFTPQH